MRSTHARIISKRNSRQTRRGEKQEEGGERKVIKKVMEGGEREEKNAVQACKERKGGGGWNARECSALPPAHLKRYL